MQSNKKIKVRKSGTLNSDSNGEFNVRWLNGASVHCCRYNIFMHIINHSCNQNIWKVKCGEENGLKKWEYEKVQEEKVMSNRERFHCEGEESDLEQVG